jgi:phosphoheptose isomerase
MNINKHKNISKKFFIEYINNANQALNSIDLVKLDYIYRILKKTISNNKQIFVAGNGGSASVANHLLCDFNKGIKKSSNNKLIPKVISLSNSIETITAISNDLNYEDIFSFQVENYARPGDCLLALSCSGTSKNIIKVIKRAKKLKIKSIFITGFAKKNYQSKTITHLNINCQNYGITEDIFASIMHMISQFIRYKFNKKEIL